MPFNFKVTSSLIVLFSCIQLCFSQQISQGLIGFYPFNQDATDQSNQGTTNNGTVSNVTFEKGVIDSSIFFNGSTGIVNLNSNFFVDTSYSISFWINPRSIKHGSIFSMRSQCLDTNGGWDRVNIALSGPINPSPPYLNSSEVSVGNQLLLMHNRFNSNCNGWGNRYIYTIPHLSIDTSCFTHIVVSVSNNSSNLSRDYELYINGQHFPDTLFKIPNSNNLLNSTDPFNIALSSFNSYFGMTHDNFNYSAHQLKFHGLIDHVRVYNRKVSQLDVIQLFQEGIVLQKPVLNFKDSVVCENDLITIKVTPTSGYSFFNWEVNSSDIGMVDSLVLTKRMNLNDTVKFMFSTNNTCFVDTITQIFYPNSVVEDTITERFCQGDSIFFNQVWLKNPGTYKYTTSTATCDSIITLILSHIQVNVNLGNDTVLCIDDSLTLNAGHHVNKTFLWQDGSTNSTYTVSTAGQYWVQVTDSCTTSDTINVDFSPSVNLDFGEDTILCSGQTITLDATSPNSSYLWQDGSLNPIKIITNGGLYSVTVSNSCETKIDSVTVIEDACNCLVYMPNMFSPNKDGINDIFIPKFDCEFSRYELIIFNRWGEEIFKTIRPNEAWDGTQNGENASIGTYVYLLKYKSMNGPNKTLAGSITIIK